MPDKAKDEWSTEFSWANPKDPQKVRLVAALIDARFRLAQLQAKRETGPRNELESIYSSCKDCLDAAMAHAPHASYVAWDCLHQFDEAIVDTLDEQERYVQWTSLVAEAKKKLKDSWREAAVDSILKEQARFDACAAKHRSKTTPGSATHTDSTSDTTGEEGTAHVAPVHLLRALQRQVAINAQNQQHKLELFETRSLPWVVILLAAAVVVSLAFAALLLWIEQDATVGVSNSFRGWLAEHGRSLALSILLGVPAGALGGILSTAFSLGKIDLNAKIPEMRLGRLVTITRPLLGAVVAIPVLVLFHAKIITVSGLEGNIAVFAFCFLGGFSERWFLGVVEKFETKAGGTGEKNGDKK